MRGACESLQEQMGEQVGEAHELAEVLRAVEQVFDVGAESELVGASWIEASWLRACGVEI